MAHAHGNISVLPNAAPVAGTFDEIRGASLNPILFKPEAISAETLAANEKFRKATAGAPNWWDIGAPAMRAAAASGKGAFPRPEKSSRATTIHVDGKGGHRVALRVIAPPGRVALICSCTAAAWYSGPPKCRIRCWSGS